jgi:hypothetical protein
MVKGNADRRRQLVAKRKEDQSNENQRKKSGPQFATHSEVRARLLDYCQKGRIEEAELVAYLVEGPGPGPGEVTEAVNGQAMLCSSHLRTGSCPLKRCRFKHVFSLSHLDQIPIDCGKDDQTEVQGVPQMIQVPLRQANINDRLVYDRRIRTKCRLPSTLRFISYSNRLIFDYANPYVFGDYVAKEHAKADLLERKEIDESIHEPDFDQEQQIICTFQEFFGEDNWMVCAYIHVPCHSKESYCGLFLRTGFCQDGEKCAFNHSLDLHHLQGIGNVVGRKAIPIIRPVKLKEAKENPWQLVFVVCKDVIIYDFQNSKVFEEWNVSSIRQIPGPGGMECI